MNIIGKKNLYFAISLLIIVPGTISLLLNGLKLSIDFIGGSRIEYSRESARSSSARQISNQEIERVFRDQKVEVNSIQKSGKDVFIVRTKPINEKTYKDITTSLKKKYKNVKELGFQTIGPTISREITLNAVKAVALASLLIVLYISWSFRKVPKPASSWRFGICAILALLHDVLLVTGVFSLLGYFFGVEVDSLFVTALLTIIGFSVHDTIVVFDRIRENLRRMAGSPFTQVVNDSIIQTMSRSLNTSLTVLLVLFTMLLFGGESIKWFIVALLVGITSGTYSSIFNAAPLLVLWEEWRKKNIK